MQLAEIKELSERDPAEAHRLVAQAIGVRGHEPFFQHLHRQECIRRAMAKPLPGASGAAFTTGAIKVAGKVVNRVVPTHFAALQALQSPLLAMMENATATTKAEVDFDDEQQWQICFVFTSDARELRKMLKSEGIDAIKVEAEKACSDWSAAEINFVMLAVIEQLKRHVETTVKFAAEMEEKGDISFFLQPSQNPSTLPASGS